MKEQKENNIEIVLEGVLKVLNNGQVIAIVHNDMKKRAHVFYSCNEMGVDDIKSILDNLRNQ